MKCSIGSFWLYKINSSYSYSYNLYVRYNSFSLLQFFWRKSKFFFFSSPCLITDYYYYYYNLLMSAPLVYKTSSFWRNRWLLEILILLFPPVYCSYLYNIASVSYLTVLFFLLLRRRRHHLHRHNSICLRLLRLSLHC